MKRALLTFTLLAFVGISGCLAPLVNVTDSAITTGSERSASIKELGKRDWEMAESGFWRPEPYLALSESFYYENEDVTLNQHIVIAEDGEYDIYRFWVHTFSHSDMNRIFVRAGFNAVNCYDKVIPDSELCSSDSVTFCTFKK